jgi:type 1 glutamine amidotransferase
MKPLNILFLQGGWYGHKPEQIVQKFTTSLIKQGCKTETITSLERLTDTDWLKTFDVISPCWTMGQLSAQESAGLRGAVHEGVGLGGIHGGMGDAFRGDLDYEWMVGGHFVGHPHVGDYTIRVTHPEDPIMKGLPAEFSYKSEQYYLLMDPGVRVLAESDYTFEERTCTMPVVWTKNWGKGRVFYSALGHDPAEFDSYPQVFQMSLNGILWAGNELQFPTNTTS